MSELSLDKIDNLVGSVNSEIYIGYVKDEEEIVEEENYKTFRDKYNA